MNRVEEGHGDISWLNVLIDDLNPIHLRQVEVPTDNGAITYRMEDVITTSVKWECCLLVDTLGLRPHFPSLREFILWKWEIEG